MKKPRKMTVAALEKELNICIKNIAKERDKLRNLIEDAEAIENDCDESILDMEHAAECLSKYL